MAEDRARAEQAVARVDVEIGLGPRELPLDEGDLGEVLVEVGLHIGVAMLARRARPTASNCASVEVTAKRGVIA